MSLTTAVAPGWGEAHDDAAKAAVSWHRWLRACSSCSPWHSAEVLNALEIDPSDYLYQ